MGIKVVCMRTGYVEWLIVNWQKTEHLQVGTGFVEAATAESKTGLT